MTDPRTKGHDMDPEETTASPDPAAVLESALDELATTQAELDATRAKLAEAEALVLQLTEGMEEYCRLRDANPVQVALTAAESRVAALTEALTNARTHVYCGCSRPRVRHAHDCPRGKVEAALSPSQDAKDGGAV